MSMGGGRLPAGGGTSSRPRACNHRAVAAAGRRRAPGRLVGRDQGGNKLKERFLASAAFKTVYEDAYRDLYRKIYADGAA